MQLTPVSLNCNSNGVQKPAFKANAAPIIEDVTNELFTSKNSRLLRKVEILFDEAWAKIKSKKQKMVPPEFSHITKGQIVTLKPFYGGTQAQIMLNVEKGDLTERLLIPRGFHGSYRYEKIKKTQYGSATIQSFNSNIQKDSKMDMHINSLLEENLPAFLNQKREERHLAWLR